MHCSYHIILKTQQTFIEQMTSSFMLIGCPAGVKITTFRGPRVRLIFGRQTTDFSLKHGPPNGVHNHQMWVSIFRYFFDAALDPCFHDFLFNIDSKMVPTKLSFLRPLTLLKCTAVVNSSNISLFLALESVLRSLFGTPPEQYFCQF